MKRLVSAFAVFATLFLSTSAVADIAPLTREITVPLSDVYIPGGFSSEMDVYIIGNGMFPNSCYAWARVEVNHVSPLVHEIRSVASVRQTKCLMVLVPYHEEIHLGRLQSGDHTLRFINGDGTYFEKSMKVE